MRIFRELQERGITKDLAGQVIADADIDWCSCLRQARIKKFGSRSPVDFKDKARQLRFLQYRGFSADQLQEAFDQD